MADEAGIKAIVQPGGSIRDQESIDYCDEHDMTWYSMVIDILDTKEALYEGSCYW